jgi:hypothetical protein
MLRTHSIFFALLISLLFSSWSSSSIIAKSSDKLKGPYQRIFVLINNSVRADGFIKGFTTNIKEEFNKRNISYEIYIKTELSLDTEKDIEEKISAFSPDALLVINQTEAVVYNGGRGANSNGGTFDLKLFDKTPDNLVWRATLQAFGNFGIATASGKATDYFIARLEYDKIITKL